MRKRQTSSRQQNQLFTHSASKKWDSTPRAVCNFSKEVGASRRSLAFSVDTSALRRDVAREYSGASASMSRKRSFRQLSRQITPGHLDDRAIPRHLSPEIISQCNCNCFARKCGHKNAYHEADPEKHRGGSVRCPSSGYWLPV